MSKNESNRVNDILIYKNPYAPNKNFDVFLGSHIKTFVCRRCLKSHTNVNTLMNHKEKCGQHDICSFRTPNVSQPHWRKKHLHENPLNLRIIAVFEADNEIDNSSRGNKTANNIKQNPVCNCYFIISELEVVLKSGYSTSKLNHDNVDWIVEDVLGLNKKMTFFLKTLITTLH